MVAQNIQIWKKNYLLQKKILKFIYFRNRRDHCEDIFQRHKILSLFELHIYEMLKFVLRSIYQLHSEKYLNDLFSFENKRSTRNDSYNLLHEPLCRKKAGRLSVRFRAAKLYNLLAKQNLFTTFDNCTVNDISNLYHKLKDSCILNNRELVKHIFFSVRVISLIPFTCMLQHYQNKPGFFRRKQNL